MDKLWNSIISCLEETLSVPNFQIFKTSANPVSFSDNILVLKVNSPFSKGWIKEKCEPILKQRFHESEYQSLILDFVIDDTISSQEKSPQMSLFTPTSKDESEPITQFNPAFTFDNFIVGSNNRFAHAAAQAISTKPAKAYNPLFIYGSVGLGKTHLLHAIGHEINTSQPNFNVSLVTSEQFTNDLINSLKDKKTKSFKNKYRSVDVLLVDDIQFLAGKETTQEEFFHTFNELHNHHKQIVLTSDRPPRDIPTLQDRLKTRFAWGLIADIQPPELETRIAILRQRVETNNIMVPDEILHYIATQIPSNVRELEGALNRIFAYSSLLNTEITLSIASNVIKDMVGIKQERPVTASLIQRHICRYFDIHSDDLSSKKRTRELAYARQIAMYLVRELTNMSLPKIGETFGNRDHSTVMHACDKIKALTNYRHRYQKCH